MRASISVPLARTGALLFACAVLLATLPTARLAHASDERLFYEITVTNPGTRSQGWHGTLYNQDGHAMDVAPGQTVTTNVGDFVSVACAELWVPCGMIHADTVKASALPPAILILATTPAAPALSCA